MSGEWRGSFGLAAPAPGEAEPSHRDATPPVVAVRGQGVREAGDGGSGREGGISLSLSLSLARAGPLLTSDAIPARAQAS